MYVLLNGDCNGLIYLQLLMSGTSNTYVTKWKMDGKRPPDSVGIFSPISTFHTILHRRNENISLFMLILSTQHPTPHLSMITLAVFWDECSGLHAVP